MNQREVVLCSPVRTAIGTCGGTLNTVPSPDRGAAIIGEALKPPGIAYDPVRRVVMGNVIEAAFKMNPPRQVAGQPVAVPVLTVNRVYGCRAQMAAAAKDVDKVASVVRESGNACDASATLRHRRSMTSPAQSGTG